MLLVSLFSPSAFAGFAIEGSPTTGTSVPPMGQYEPYNPRGEGSFVTDAPSMKPKQARYNKDQLIVDLAYTSLTQTGHGDAARTELFADSVPFDDTIRMVMPTGWMMYRAEGTDKKVIPETVSIIERGRWTDILSRIGERYALAFHVDWYQHTIMVSAGRPPASASDSPGKIKVIQEPVHAAAPVKSIASSFMPKAGAGQSKALVTAAPMDKTISAGPIVASATSKPLVPLSTAKVSTPAKSIVAATTPIAPTVAKPVVAPPKPVVPAKPKLVAIYILPGTLSENVKRLSKLNGWNPPEWDISGDYKVNTAYTLEAKTFQEAIAKLLMLHPIEADVNVGQRKVYVLKEIQ